MNIILNTYRKIYNILTNKYVIFFIIALNPLLDVLYTITSKYLNLDLIINYNQILRMLIICIMFVSIKKINYIKKILLYGFILLIGFIINLATNMTTNIILDFSFYFKLLYGIVAFYWGRDLVENERISLNELYSSLIFGTLLIAIIIIISFLGGIGLRSYAEQTSRWGYKGFFTAQNVVALVNFVGLFLFNIKNHNGKFIKIILGSLIYICAGLIIGTKGSILFTFLTIVCLIIFYIYRYRKSISIFFHKNKRLCFIIGIILLLVFLLGLLYVLFFFYGYYKKLDYFNSFYSFLVSGRNIQLNSCIEIFTENFTKMWVYLPFGTSYSYVEGVLLNVFSSYHSLEQDIFAMLLYTGIFGLIYILATYLDILKCIIRNFHFDDSKEISLLELMLFVLVMIYSFFIGHFLFESLACFFIWLSFSTFYKKEEKNIKKKNKISVIIRTYNEEDKLPYVLDMLKKQTYQPVEIIIVDSESTDSTVQIAKNYGCKIVYIKKSDFNYSYASNIGAEYANGNILVYLSGHSIPYNINYLEIINNVFQNEHIGGCYGDTLALADGSITEKIFNSLSHLKHYMHGNVIENTIHQGILSCSNAALRKKCWKSNHFDINIVTGGEDVLMAYHILNQGYLIMRCPSMLVRHSHKKKYKEFKKEVNNWNIQYNDVLNYIKKLEDIK